MSNTIATAEEAVNRLIADPAYRIGVAVENNYTAVLRNYQAQRMTMEAPGIGTLAMKLTQLYRSGYGSAGIAGQISGSAVGHAGQVDNILDVPWIAGRNDMMDAAYLELQAIVEDNRNNIEDGKFFGLDVAIAALANLAGTIGAGGRARDAAEAEQERLAALAAMQADQNAANAAQQKNMLKLAGIGVAVVVAIIIVVLFIRKRNAQ